MVARIGGIGAIVAHNVTCPSVTVTLNANELGYYVRANVCRFRQSPHH